MNTDTILETPFAGFEVLSLITELESKEVQVNEAHIMDIMTKIYNNTIIKFKNLYTDEDKTYADIEDYSGFVIDIADTSMLAILKWYALDNASSPYELPAHKLARMKQQFCKILMANEKQKQLLSEVFKSIFFSSYTPIIKKASIQRRLVPQERPKVMHETNS